MKMAGLAKMPPFGFNNGNKKKCDFAPSKIFFAFFLVIGCASHNELQSRLHIGDAQHAGNDAESGEGITRGKFYDQRRLAAIPQQNKEKYFDRNSYRRISLRVKNVQSYSGEREKKKLSMTKAGTASVTSL